MISYYNTLMVRKEDIPGLIETLARAYQETDGEYAMIDTDTGKKAKIFMINLEKMA